MNIGLIGPAKSGKTTIFNALTGQAAEVAEYGTGKVEPNLGVVTVLDDRVDRFSAMYKPKKTIYATIEFIDFIGVTEGAARGGLFSGEGMAMMKTADAFVTVLRNFRSAAVEGQFGEANPERDMDTIDSELLLADLIVAERRVERIAADHQRGKKTPQSQAEEKIMARVTEALNAGQPVRGLEFSADEQRLIQGYQFLTAKPALVILNSGEENYGKNDALLSRLSAKHAVIEFAGNFEMELASLDEADRAGFMADMGITESARARLSRFAYEMLGYISFFTVGEDEVRAWTIHRGEKAVAAAGTIHSDLAKGFIRAECFSAKDLLELGSEKAVKDKGLFRLEGKDYVVADGDILHIRFSV
ncbi:MAG: redox-regulated ATPase YchF [Spirochaetales bacterium]|jgi:GTP-binding protein YchF|nr:redox-regulated ATPase YchF [Spirochaetales bacterium]